MKYCRSIHQRVFCSSLLVVLTACSSNDPLASDVDILIECATHTQEMQTGKLRLECTATNTSNRELELLVWNTPLEGNLYGDILDIRNNAGDRMDYQGLMVKRAAPTPDDYITLKAHEELSISLDLSRSYAWCADTDYTIRYSAELNGRDSAPLKLSMRDLTLTTTSSFTDCENLQS